jgi:DEAD/DEAH box helicase domain-containing protein
MNQESSVEQTIEWLRDRPYYEGQITYQERTPGNSAETSPVDIDPRLASALSRRDINEPFQHQADAIEAVRDGDHVVLATPTASGKSLAYTVPSFERASGLSSRRPLGVSGQTDTARLW